MTHERINFLLAGRLSLRTLFEMAGPSCIFGKCDEARSCGKPYKDMGELLLH